MVVIYQMKNKLLSISILLSLFGCKRQEVDGIRIGETLYVHQSLDENQRFRSLIEQTLKKDSQALVGLQDFPCGGGAGCYDLGVIITEIVYRNGEADFIAMVKKLSQNQKRQIWSYIRAGLEYGDFNSDGKTDNKRIEDEFPELFDELNK